jgi:cation diffusion facilitator CzcD-associated flavoprotein CzcO
MLSYRKVAVAALLGLSTASETYDYVIVGGGVTGLVVANRLTEDKKSKSNRSNESGTDTDRYPHRVRPSH